jgi:hypothetical protein
MSGCADAGAATTDGAMDGLAGAPLPMGAQGASAPVAERRDERT